jgi:hypothetical protein
MFSLRLPTHLIDYTRPQIGTLRWAVKYFLIFDIGHHAEAL